LNYLIVMPKGSSRGETTHSVIFPMGTAYISAYLKSMNLSVHTANLEYVNASTQDALAALIEQHDIDAICIGGLSRDYHKILEVVAAAKTVKPSILAIVGGGIISADPEPAMSAIGADIGVIGEGELTIGEMVKALDEGNSYDDIPGIIYRRGNVLVRNSARSEIKDLDSLPFPDLAGFDYARYVNDTGGGLIVGSRSCTHKCTYCFHPSGQVYRQRSLDNIFKEVDHQYNEFGVRSFGFSDELFASKKSRVIDFCQRIKKYNVCWAVGLRVRNVDLEMLKLMKQSGCTSICYGLESADDAVLLSMRKNITVAHIENALNLTFEAAINVDCQFIFGDIMETPDSVEKTLAFWHKENQRTQINLNMIIAYPGTFLYKYACDQGIITDREQFLKDGCPLVNVSKLTNEEYQALFSRTEELKLHSHTLAKAISIREINAHGDCLVEVTCRRCDHHFSHSLPFWFKAAVNCPNCNLINEIEPIGTAEISVAEFTRNLPATGEIVIWGAGGIYYKLSQLFPFFNHSRFSLVDSDRKKHGLSICGHRVEDPQMIHTKSIDVVLVTAISRVHDICSDIITNYPSVRTILVPSQALSIGQIIPTLASIPTSAPLKPHVVPAAETAQPTPACGEATL
jgi:anaerobic magnesium-protoporphyrin IX monomethyl ester cyclase